MFGPTADPVSAPKAYQRLLVGMVGDNDPAEVQARAALDQIRGQG